MPQGDDAKASPDPPDIRQDRVVVGLVLEISGLDLEGKDFVTEAKTKMVSRSGASIVTRKLLAPEQTLTVKRAGAHPEAEVSVIGQSAARPRAYLRRCPAETLHRHLGHRFPCRRERARRASNGVSYLHTRENVILHDFELIVLEANKKISRRCPKCQDVTMWKKSASGVPTEPVAASATPATLPAVAPPAAVPSGRERRQHSRLKVHMKGCIRFGGQETHIEVVDMSRGGVRFRSRRDYAVGLHVRTAIPYTPGGSNIFVPAQICWSKPLPDGTSEYGLRYVKE